MRKIDTVSIKIDKRKFYFWNGEKWLITACYMLIICQAWYLMRSIKLQLHDIRDQFVLWSELHSCKFLLLSRRLFRLSTSNPNPLTSNVLPTQTHVILIKFPPLSTLWCWRGKFQQTFVYPDSVDFLWQKF